MPAGASAPPEYLRVLDHDPDLAAGLGPEAFAEAQRRSLAPRITAGRGAWEAKVLPLSMSGTLGLLVLEGLLARDVSISSSSTMELLGTGDVIRPWTWTDGETRSIPVEASWQVMQPALFAVLDREFALRMAQWPEIGAGLLERAAERARSLAIQLTIRQATVDERVLLMLWHLADRWGRVRADGTLVHIPRLTQGMLARLVGASRPTVSTIVGQLRDQGAIERHPEGYWLLPGDPPAAVVRSRPGVHIRAVEVSPEE